MKKIDITILISALVLAVVLMETIIFGGLGAGVLVAVGVYFICILSLVKLEKRKMNKLAKWLFVPIILCTLCFSIFSNITLKLFNVIFLVSLVIIQGIELFGNSQYEAFLPEWVIECVKCGIQLPFKYINMPLTLMRKEIDAGEKKHIKIISKILIGVVIALPMLVLVTVWLASADAAFSGVIDKLIGLFDFRLNEILGRMITIGILFFLVASYFYGLIHKEKGSPIKIYKPKMDFVIVSTVVTMLCLIYLIFCFSQLAYFISAFQGILPSDFTFAEYARRGFFEMLPLTAFNLVGLLILSVVIKGEVGKKNIYLKGMLCFITGFTLFIVISALSKLCMYMQQYGLSLRRVYAAWFLCLCIMIVLVVFAKVFWEKIGAIKVTFILFTVMYLGLNYSNVDYLVARQNVDLYMSGKTSDISGCYNLSTSAMGPIEELIVKRPEVLINEETSWSIEGINSNLSSRRWQDFNLADHMARKSNTTISNKYTFNINFINDMEDEVYEICYTYGLNGEEYGCGGIRNADNSRIERGESLLKDFIEEDFRGETDLSGFEIRFSIIGLREYKIDSVVKINAEYGKNYDIILQGNQEGGYRAILVE